MATKTLTPRRRDVLIQLAATAVMAGCAETSNPPAPGGDPVYGGDTGTGGADDTGAGGGESGGGTGNTDDTGAHQDTGDTGDTGEMDEAWDKAECDQTSQPLPGDGAAPTPGMSEGPFFREDLPERSELDVRGDQQTVLILSGRLLGPDRQPLAGVKVCLWHANDDGIYQTDSTDHHLYGWQLSAEDGGFCFKTSRPAPYMDLERGVYNPGHLHWKLFQDGEALFTTQHSFQDDPYLENADFPEACLLAVEELAPGLQRCRFDFILPTGG